MGGAHYLGGLVGLAGGAEEAEAGGAGAGHAGEDTALGLSELCDDVADDGNQLDGGRLQIVAGFGESEAELGRSSQWRG